MYKGILTASLILGVASAIIGIVSLVHPNWIKFCFSFEDPLAAISSSFLQDTRIQAEKTDVCITRGLFQIVGGINVGVQSRVISVPDIFWTPSYKATMALVIVGIILLLPATFAVISSICCYKEDEQGKRSRSLIGLMFFLCGGLCIFAGAIVYTVTQNHVLKNPETFFSFYHTALSATSEKPVIGGNSDIDDLLGNLPGNGDFSDFDIDFSSLPGFPPNAGDLFSLGTGSDNSDNTNTRLSDSPSFLDGVFSNGDLTSLLGPDFPSNFGDDSSDSTSNAESATFPDFSPFLPNNLLPGFSSGDDNNDTDYPEIPINTGTSPPPLYPDNVGFPDLNLPGLNLPGLNLPEGDTRIPNILSPLQKAIQDFPSLQQAKVTYGVSYILAWVSACVAILAALFAIIGRSQIHEEPNIDSEDDHSSEKKEKLSISA